MDTFFCDLKLALLKKKKKFFTKKSKFSKNCLNELTKVGLIKAIKNKNENTLEIMLTMTKNNASLIKDISKYQTKTIKRSVKNSDLTKQLKVDFYSNSFFLLQTSNGIINSIQANQLASGGWLIFRIQC